MNLKLLDTPFWKIAVRFFLVFIIIISALLLVLEYFGEGNLDAVERSLQDGSWKQFVLTKLAMALVYALAMTYFLRKKAKKSLRK